MSITKHVERTVFYDFEDQSLVTFIPRRSSMKNKVLPLQLPSSIHSIERNLNGQIYVLNDLHNNPHFTMPTSDLLSSFNHSTIRFDDKESSEAINYLHIPNNSNYISEDNKMIIINDETSPIIDANRGINIKSNAISFCTRALTKMFWNGLSESFNFTSKKRSNRSKSTRSESHTNNPKRTSHSKARNLTIIRKKMSSKIEASTHTRYTTLDPLSLPMCTTGWSTIDCNEYSDNMSTIAGTVRPFLKDGNIPIAASKHLVSMIEYLLRLLPSDHLFNNTSTVDEYAMQMRKDFQNRFRSLLLSGDESKDCGESSSFRVEGITILIPSSIGIHTDTLNCHKDGMTSVLSINCRIPMNDKTIPSGDESKLWNWLVANGNTDYFNCSVICYSRSCIGNFVDKATLSFRLSQRDQLRKCLHWALTDRVGSVVDYRSRVWNSTFFPNTFRTMKKKRPTSTFQGQYMIVPASYDKIVSQNVYFLVFSLSIFHRSIQLTISLLS